MIFTLGGRTEMGSHRARPDHGGGLAPGRGTIGLTAEDGDCAAWREECRQSRVGDALPERRPSP
jgi:hypothetical protein